MIKVREDITGWVMSENGVQDSRLIEEVSYPEVYDGCLTQKVIWE